MSLFIDSGAGLVLSIWFIITLVLNSEKNFIIVKLTVCMGVGLCSYNEWTNRLRVYRRLLKNRLHG